MNKLFRITLNIVTLLALAVAYFDPEAAAGLFGGGVSLAATPVSGGTMTYGGIDDQKPEYFEEDISQKITQIRPSRYPFDNFLRHLGNDKPAYSMKVQFEEDGYFKRDGTITDVTLIDGGTSATMTTTESERFNIDDIISIPSVEVNVEGQMRDLVVMVTDKSATNLTVVPLGRTNWNTQNPESITIPSITTTDPVPAYRMSNTKSETDAQTIPKSILPDREWNYGQTQMAQLEESILSQNMRAKSGHQKFSANNTHALLNFRSECEYAAKFGPRDTGIKDNAQWWTMGGFTTFVNKRINYQKGNIITENWVDWTRQAFSDIQGSDDRHLLCDQFLLADILKVPEVQRQLDGRDIEVVRGIRCRRIETDFGTMYLTFDRSLQEIGKRYYGMLVDPANVRRRVIEPLSTQPLDLDRTGQRRVKAVRMLETYSLEVRVPDSHALIIGQD
jgi:hypothetical protein